MWTQKMSFQYAERHLPEEGLLGNNLINEQISCFTQFDPLQVVIIGSIDHNTRMMPNIIEYGDTSLILRNYGLNQVETERIQKAYKQVNVLPQTIVQTTRKQQQNTITELQKRGIKVVRSGYVDHSIQFQINGIKTAGNSNFNARDLIFTFDDSLYEFPSVAHCRKHEMRCFQWIQKQLSANGSKIYKAPDLTFNKILYQKDQNFELYKTTDLVFADAANLIKLGLDILFQVSMSGSWGAYKNFRKLIEQRYDKKVRVHPICNVYEYTHIDTTICVIGWNNKIQKFIVLVDDRDVTPKNIPAIFRGKNWAVIQITDIIDEQPGYQERFLSSEKIVINFLPINSELILMSDKQTRLHEIFEFYGIEVIKMAHTYGRHIQGGFHCMSNDIKRKDSYGFRDILNTPKGSLDKNKLAGLFDVDLLEFLVSKGDLEEWVKICNQNNIYPTYLKDHMTPQQLNKMQAKHKNQME